MDRIDEMVKALALPRGKRHAIERELRAHVAESRRDLELAGVAPDEAEREAVSRLGDIAEIAEGFDHVYRPPAKLRVAVAFSVAGALMLLGIYGGPLASATAAHHAPAHAARVHHHAR